jgi:hypothetical protein
VWQGNPFRWGDFTSNHSTFASLLLPVLARLDSQGTDGAGEMLDAAINFQIFSRQSNGQFKHIGFQVDCVVTFADSILITYLTDTS